MRAFGLKTMPVIVAFLLAIGSAVVSAAAPRSWWPERLVTAANNPPQTLDLRVEGQVNPDHLTTFYPVFSWTFYDPDGDRQTDYQVWVGSSPGNADIWSSGVIHRSDNWTVYNFNGTGKDLQRGVTYYLQVRTKDGNTWSEWAQATFRLNQLPIVSNFVATGDAPLFSWTYYDPDGDRQTHFWLQVWTWFFDLIWNTGPVAGDNTSVLYNFDGRGEPLQQGRTYYACVFVKDGYEWSWPVWTQFTIDRPPVVTAVYVQGFIAGSEGIIHITDNTPDISWEYYDPGDTQSSFHVEVWTGSGRTGTLMDNSYIVVSSSTTYTYGSSGFPEAQLLDGENYYVSVRVKTRDKWSEWSEARFRMNTPPVVSELNVQGYCAGDARLNRITDRTPEVGWRYADNESDNQRKYMMRIWRVPEMTLVWDPGPVENSENRAVCENLLVDGENYLVGVMVNDGYEWSAENYLEFRVNFRPVVSDLSVGGFPVPVISWSYSDGDRDSQSLYQVQFWTGPGGSGENVWDSGEVPGTSTSVSYGGPQLEDGATYYVRVRASDNYEWSGWEEVSFVYGAEPLNPQKLGSVTLRTLGTHYPSQTYVYEGGAVILVQDGVDVMFSEPSMITAGDAGPDAIWVGVKWILVEAEGHAQVSGGISTIQVTNVEELVRVQPQGGPNRKEVTIRINSAYGRAWGEYLSSVEENLRLRGYVVLRDGLALTIYGKDPEAKDIYFTEEVVKLRVQLL